MSREDAALSHQISTSDVDMVRDLPSVKETLSKDPASDMRAVRASDTDLGDDDGDEELEDDYAVDELEWT